MTGLYDRQLESVLSRGIGSDSSLNPFWGRMVNKLRHMHESGLELTAARIAAKINTRADRLPEGQTNGDNPDFRAAMASLANPASIAAASEAERDHMAGLLFLQRRGRLDPYVADMDRLGIASNQQMVRTWFYLHHLREHLAGPVDFLEIGGGSGHFAVLAIDAGLASHFVMVDLPEILLHAIATVQDLLPGRAAFLDQRPDFSGPPALWFMNPGAVGLVPASSIGAAVNFNSFSEMDEGVRDAYIAEVYRTASPGCIFYNVNRRHPAMTRLDGSPFENHPMRYPYRADDELIEWEPDEYQQATRTRVLFAPPHRSFCISRICRVAPAS